VYKIVLDDKFYRKVGKLSRDDRQLTRSIEKVLRLIRENINHPSLRLHKLSGSKHYSISVDMSIRIIAKIDHNVVYLLEIGKHEEVY